MQPISFSDRHVALGEHQVFVRHWQATAPDAGPPILLFHESLGCIPMWRGFPARLCAATGRRVIAYDRLGHGQSSPSARAPNSDFIADETRQVVVPLLDALGIDRFIGYGHSTGGSIALAAAGQLGERCAGVISEAGHAFVEACTLQGVEQARLRFQAPARFQRLRHHHGERAQWVLDTWVQTWLAPWFNDWRLDDLLAAIHCPTLLLQGSQDPYGSLEQPRHIAAMIGAAATVVVMEGCGHAPHLERTDEVVRHVGRFLERIGGRAGV